MLALAAPLVTGTVILLPNKENATLPLFTVAAAVTVAITVTVCEAALKAMGPTLLAVGLAQVTVGDGCRITSCAVLSLLEVKKGPAADSAVMPSSKIGLPPLL